MWLQVYQLFEELQRRQISGAEAAPQQAVTLPPGYEDLSQVQSLLSPTAVPIPLPHVTYLGCELSDGLRLLDQVLAEASDCYRPRGSHACKVSIAGQCGPGGSNTQITETQ